MRIPPYLLTSLVVQVEQIGPTSVSLSLSLYVCVSRKTIFELNNLWACWFTLTLSASLLKVKVMGQSLRSQEKNVAKVVDMATSGEWFLVLIIFDTDIPCISRSAASVFAAVAVVERRVSLRAHLDVPIGNVLSAGFVVGIDQTRSIGKTVSMAPAQSPKSTSIPSFCCFTFPL